MRDEIRAHEKGVLRPDIRVATPQDLASLVTLTLELRRFLAGLGTMFPEPREDEVRAFARRYLHSATHLVLLAEGVGGPVGFIRVNVQRGGELVPLPGRRLPRREAILGRLRRWRRPAPSTVPCALYVADLYVRPAQRRRGLGSELLAAARETMAPLGPDHVVLSVLAQNEAGRAFWEKAGFHTETLIMVSRGAPGIGAPDR